MSVDYVGALTIGGAIPGAAGAVTAGIDGINGALPDLSERITTLQTFYDALAGLSLDVSFSSQLSLANQMVTAITDSIAAGLPEPSISAQISATAALVSSLETTLATANANLSVCTGIDSLLATAGLHVYAYSGAVSALGAGMTSELSGGVPGGSGGSESCNALILVTTNGGTWTAMGSVFKVTP